MRKYFVICTITTILVSLTSSANGGCFDKDVQAEIIATSNNVDNILDGFTEFGIQLFKSSIKMNNVTQDYIFLSPMSIWFTLTTMFLGARSDTQMELRKVLKFGNMDKNVVVDQLSELKEKHFPHITKTEDVDDAILLENNFYVQENEPMRSCVMRQLDMDLDILKVNLTADPELKQVINGINALVSFQTEGRIAELIPPEYVDSTTRMLVINTASFYGHWKHPFESKNTKQENFFLQPNETIKIDMMHDTNNYRVANSTVLNCAAIELPYNGNEMALVILLPHENVEDLIAKQNEKELDQLFGKMESELIDIALPKFKIEQATELRDVLNAVGLNHLFNASMANLTGFSEKRGLYLRGIRHLPFIEFNEKGTTEFAENEVTVKNTREIANATSSAEISTPFVVNRPFVFFLRHNILQKNLFMGLTREPSY